MLVLAQPVANAPTFNTFDNGALGNDDGTINPMQTTDFQLDGKIIIEGDFTNEQCMSITIDNSGNKCLLNNSPFTTKK